MQTTTACLPACLPLYVHANWNTSYVLLALTGLEFLGSLCPSVHLTAYSIDLQFPIVRIPVHMGSIERMWLVMLLLPSLVAGGNRFLVCLSRSATQKIITRYAFRPWPRCNPLPNARRINFLLLSAIKGRFLQLLQNMQQNSA